MDMILEYLYCCQYTTNDQLLDLFEDLAMKRQKCPISNKIQNYGDDYHKLYLDVLKHFRKKDDSNRPESPIVKNWASIRKKALKDLILKNFIIEVKNTYEFGKETMENLHRELMIGLNFKNINDRNIIIQHNKIVDIIGLNLSKNSFSWDFDIHCFN